MSPTIDNLSNKELLEGLKNPEKAAEIIAHIQNELTTIVNAFNEMKELSKNNSALCEEYKTQVVIAQKANVDLVQSIKQIHIALSAHIDVLPLDLQNLTQELAKFVLSSSVIKAGVISNANT